MLSRSVEAILHDAVLEMQRRRHEMLTVEHLLYAACKSAKGRTILEGSGAGVDRLREQLEEFFSSQLEVLAADEAARGRIIQTNAVRRVFVRALDQVRSSGRNAVEMGDLLIAIMDEEGSYARYFLHAQGVERLDMLTFISHGLASDNPGEERRDAPGCPAAETGRDGKDRKDPLAECTVDLTARARAGGIDPLVGRARELDRAIEILCRRRKNNPLFVGDPGVGKTALAEGLALRIAEGRVPRMFANTRIFALNMGLLVAGTRYRGDFEARIKAIVEAFKAMPDAILFIDEIHTLVGAGETSGGSLDAANMLKPALASGEIRCIGSTTHEEFRKHFEKDRALARRFQRIDLAEPSVEECVEILHGLESRYAEHHGVRYTPAVLRSMAELSARHVRDRLLPDKAIDVMDECGAAVRLRQPEAAGADASPEADAAARNPGHRPLVTMNDVERVVARMAGVPPRTVSGSERERLAHLERDLRRRVFGQDEAIGITARAILRARAGLGQARRPAGSFLFYGPTGVGKTEVAKSLAEIMGVEFLRFDMSEYMEKHAVARLIGSPPGYVGYDEGGQLTEAVRKAPYSVVLLDEVEKAHPDIFNVLLQVMDYGTLTDNSGRKTDFANVILIMTSNAGAFEMATSAIGFGAQRPEEAAHKGLKAVERLFAPEFRNRLDALVPFNSLGEPMMLRIVDKFLAELRASLADRSVVLYLSGAARRWLAQRGYDPAMGARRLARLMRTELEDRLAGELLFGALKKGGTARVGVRADALTLEAEPARPGGGKKRAGTPHARGRKAQDADAVPA